MVPPEGVVWKYFLCRQLLCFPPPGPTLVEGALDIFLRFWIPHLGSQTLRILRLELASWDRLHPEVSMDKVLLSTVVDVVDHTIDGKDPVDSKTYRRLDSKATGISPQSLCKVGNTLALPVSGQLKYASGDRPTESQLLLIQLAKKFNRNWQN